ncbi:MAG: single-stranded DNA-binding protein [Acidobacteria bacterium]|nr:single-stranded DNA-binding protein [Acidobacteriota bacterium]
MSGGINKVILVGNLGQDPEIKYSPQGTAIANFNITTTGRRKNKECNWIDHAELHKIVAFGNLAQNCGQFLKKGRQVYVEGSIASRQYKDKQGQDRTIFEIRASTILFLGKSNAEKASEPDFAPEEQEPSQQDDNIPF